MLLGFRERRPVISILLGMAGIFFLSILFRGWTERGFALLQRPFIAAGTWMHVQARGWTDTSSCTPEKLSALEKERITLAVDRKIFERLQLENQDLHKRLLFSERKGYRLISAHLIARTASEEARTFLIDRGARDGILAGQPAIVEDGVMVGKVVSTTEATATIGSLTDPTTSTAATIFNTDQTVGVTRGLSGSLMRLQFVPHNESLHVNDLLVTSGLESGVPSGLLIGTVNSVKSDKAEPFQEAVIEPLVDMRHRDSVTVIIGYQL